MTTPALRPRRRRAPRHTRRPRRRRRRAEALVGLLNARWPQRLARLPWGVLLLVAGLGAAGGLTLWSAGGMAPTPWALPHGVRLLAFLLLAVAIGQAGRDTLMAAAYPFYAMALFGLVLVEAIGQMGGGAQRWLDLGVIRIQPSELMKVALVLALARYFHRLPRGYERRLAGLWFPALLIAMPVALVLLQPDLGTSITLVAGGAGIMFLAGMPWWYLGGPALAAAAAAPFAFAALHDYQRARILIFFDPAADPLGAGYHITQSKIAIGSGGLFGKGWGEGSQGQLAYLPEPHTDFAFALLLEEWGMAGGALVLLGFALLFRWIFQVAWRAETSFGRLLTMGMGLTLFFYVAINMLMVTGLAPVVGIPLPFVSYGGSAMLTAMLALGGVMAVARQEGAALRRAGAA